MVVLQVATLAGILLTASAEDVPAHVPKPYVQRWGIGDTIGHFDYHPATNRMITSHAHRVVLWDLSSGLAVRDFASRGELAMVAFADDGQSILVTSSVDHGPGGGLTVYDTATGAARRRIAAPPSWIHDIAISPNGRYVAAGCYHHTVSIWDAQTGDLMHRRKEHHGHVNFVRFSPDGRRLLSGGYGTTAVVWDVPTGEVLRRFPLPIELAWGAFSPDGKRIVTLGAGMYGDTARIIIWDVETRQPIHVLRRAVRAAWFDDSGLVLLEHSGELTFLELVNVEEASDGTAGRELPADETKVAPNTQSAKQQPGTETPGGLLSKGRVLLSKSGWQLRIPESDEPAVLSAPDGSWQPLNVPRHGAVTHRPLDVSPDGNQLLTAFRGHRPGGQPQGVAIWELNPPRLLQTFDARLGRFHPDGQRVLVGGDRLLTLYDLETLSASRRAAGDFRTTTGKVGFAARLKSFEIEAGEFESVQFLDGGKQLLTAGGDWYDGDEGHTLLWDTETGEQIRSLIDSNDAAYFAAMDPEQSFLAATFTYGEGGNVDFARIIDVSSGRQLQRIERERQRLDGFTLGPHGKYVATQQGGQTFIREPRSWKDICGVHGIAGSFSHDGVLLATQSLGGGMQVWLSETGSHLRSYATDLIQPRPALFHRGGATLFLAGDRDLQVWDLREEEPIGHLVSFGTSQDWLVLTSDGQVAGTKSALDRIRWRSASGLFDDGRNAERIADATDPAAVGKFLTRSLPKGESLVKLFGEEFRPAPGPAVDPGDEEPVSQPPDP